MPIIKARSSSIIDSVDLRGTPTAPTPSAGTSTTQIASTAFVSTAVSDLVNSAPQVLDTLAELAAAINNDESFASTVTGLIAEKVALSGDTMTGFLTLSADPTSNLHAATKQYVDDNINSITISSTDDVPEGSLNLYYTDTRVRAGISLSSDNTTVLDYDSTTGIFTYAHPTSDGILEGQTNQYFSQTRARESISMNSDDQQIISYSNLTGEITFTTPDTDKIVEGATNLYFTTARARQSISAGSNISYDSATGIISSTSAVDSVNGQTGAVVLDTDNIDEGSTNLYFTNARARSAVSLTTDDSNILSYDSGTGTFTFVTPTTDSVDEGSVNLYYTDARVRTAISASGDISYNSATGNFSYSTPSTDGVNEGSTNLYFTNSRARTAVSLTSSNTDVLSYDSSTGTFTFDLAAQTTDDVAEGSNNLYYTTARVRSDLSATGWDNFSYNSSTGVFDITAPSTDDVSEGTNLYFTDSRARLAVSITDAGGDGSLSYDSATGVITYTGPSASEVRAHLSATSASGVTYDSATGVFALASVPNSSLSNDSITINGATIALGGSDTLDTDDIGEGSSNLYYTDARARASISVTDSSGALSYNNTTGVITFTAGSIVASVNGQTGDVVLDTDDIDEGTNNLYYTSTRVKGELSGGTGVTYNSSTGEFSIGQSVGTTDNVTFGDVTVSGDLTVNGTLTTINSTDLTVTDKNITIADGAADAAAANGAGITVDGANATITYASGTDSWNLNKDLNVTGDVTATTFVGDVTGDVTGNLTGNVTGNLTGDVTGTVSSLSNHDTDDLAEGSSNLYFTDSRARNALSAATSGTGYGDFSYDSSTGTFTFTKVSVDNILSQLSVTDTGGDGELSYDSATGTFTFTGVSASETRAHFSATSATGVTYDSATGTFALASIPNSSLSNDSITINGATIALGGSDTLDTDDISEGLTNQYFTNTRARSAISLTTSDSSVLSYDSATGEFAFDLQGIDTDEVTEGSTNLYFTTTRARDSIGVSGDLSYNSTTGVISYSTPTTDGVSEGTTNQYFTNARARSAISLTTDNTDALSYDSLTGEFSFTLNSVDTDEIAEGPTNFYFTTARARNSISAGSNISYDSTTGIISTLAAVESVNGQTGVVVLDTDNIDEGSNNLYFTDARARAAVSLVSDNTDILAYNSATGVFDFVTPTTDAISEGSTNLYYTDARADARIAAASVRDLADVDSEETLQDGFTLVWSSSLQKFVPQNVAVTATNLNFTGDGTTTEFSTGVEVSSIDNTQVYINGLIQAPTYSYTLSTTDGVTSIVMTEAPEANDYIMIRVSSTASLTAGGVLNENSVVDGGTF